MRFDRCLATFEVEGSPSAFGEMGGRPEEWRERCRNKAASALVGYELPLKQPVKIICRFGVLRGARAHDLDNLVKPLFDALGAAGLFAPSRTGGARSEWNTDDGWIFAVDAEKEMVETGGYTTIGIYVSTTRPTLSARA